MALAGLVKGSIGFAFPLVAVPLLAIFVGPKTAVVLVAVPLVLTNAMLLAVRPVDRATIRRFLPAMAVLAPSTVLGAFLLVNLDARVLMVVMGLIASTYAGLSLVRFEPAVPPHLEGRIGLVIGVVGGVLLGSTSISGPIFALFLSGLRLPKRVFVYGITLLFSVGNFVQVVSYLRLDLYQEGLLVASLLLVPAALLGQQLGFWIQDRLEQEAFRRVVLGVVVVNSLNLVARGLGLY